MWELAAIVALSLVALVVVAAMAGFLDAYVTVRRRESGRWYEAVPVFMKDIPGVLTDEDLAHGRVVLKLRCLTCSFVYYVTVEHPKECPSCAVTEAPKPSPGTEASHNHNGR